MANTKISALPVATDLTGADFPGVQGGANKKFSTSLFTTLTGTLYQPLSSNLTLWSAEVPSDYLTTADAATGYQPLDADLTAWAGVNPSSYSTTAQIAAAYQPLDSDLTSIAGLTTASYGRSLLTLANATALAGEVDSFFLTPAEGNAAYQPLDSDLTSIAALSTTSYGRSLLELASSTALSSEVSSFFVDIGGDTMTGPLITAASTSGAAGLNIPAGTAPSSPNVGDVWQTAAGLLQVRLAGPVTRTFVMLQNANQAFTRAVFFPAGTTTEPSIRLPHGVAPSSPTNGDLWSESATGFWGRVNGTSVNLATVAGVAAAYQPLDSDLTAIAALSPSNDDIVQRKAGAWTNRTMAQLLADLSAVGTTFQPLDSDLTSWAGVTRASGFDTFVATPSSTNLRSLVTDETGSGSLVFATSPTLVTPILGTPTSGTLTNCTGLPVAGITSSTSTALGVGSLELGHASDTTLSRGASGFMAVEGKRVPSPASQASGDILYRGSTEWERLAKGTALQTLRMNSGATAPEWATAREVLTANRIYYVRSDGNDSNTGLVNNSGGAFLTLNRARDVVATLDGNGYTVTITLGTSLTGTLNLNKGFAGVAGLVVDAGANTLTGSIVVTVPMSVTVQNGTYLNTADHALTANGAGSTITVGSSVTLGTSTGQRHFNAVNNGKISISSNYTVSGAAAYHYFVQLGGIIENSGVTVTVSGTPAFATAFAYADTTGIISSFPGSYSGAATGKRYDAQSGGIINVFGSGASFFPGNVAGTGTNFGTSPYGQYS